MSADEILDGAALAAARLRHHIARGRGCCTPRHDRFCYDGSELMRRYRMACARRERKRAQMRVTQNNHHVEVTL